MIDQIMLKVSDDSLLELFSALVVDNLMSESQPYTSNRIAGRPKNFVGYMPYQTCNIHSKRSPKDISI